MGHIDHQGSRSDIPQRIQPALEVLIEARRYALQTQSEIWEFAVELDELLKFGLTPNDFRWLVRKGLVEHQLEVTLENDNGRAFRQTGDLAFPARTCFILVDDTLLSESQDGTPKPDACGKPRWNCETRELRFQNEIVKHFKWRAPNQERVLAAFEEDGWPPRTDDPLPPQQNQDAKRRLSDTIRCLNRKQINKRILFHGDGSGEGIRWEEA